MLTHYFITLASLAAFAAAQTPSGGTSEAAAARKPNIVFILTDDQDRQLGSLNYMESVKKNLMSEGTTFERHYCTNALCCPSRASLLTGKLPHNTNVTDLEMPFGGYEKFVKEGLNDQWVAPLLQKAGYKTYYTGKLMNGHTQDNYNKPFPQGLDGNNFLIGPGTYNYLHPLFQEDKKEPQRSRNYATDELADRSLKLIDRGVRSGKPFFITIATVAPHAASDSKNAGDDAEHDDVDNDESEASDAALKKYSPPIPAPRHKNLFKDEKIPDTAKNFNPDKSSGASYVKDIKKQGPDTVKAMHEYYRQRLRALQAVDDLVDATIKKLKSHNVLDNTYIVYSTDNGFHIGQHRLPPGKRCPYEEDINIPLIIRGPGIPKNQKSQLMTSHTDLLPTMLGWAKADLPKGLDGKAIPADGKAQGQVWEHTQVEHWGIGKSAKHKGYKRPFSTYKAVRVIGDGYNLFYSIWCNGDHEIYDMTKDQGQMNNLYDNKNQNINIGGKSIGLKDLENRLNTLILVLKDCKGDDCRRPWSALHPRGEVKSLADAVKGQYDQFYAKQEEVKFKECTEGYLPGLEGPEGFKKFTGQ